MAKPRTRRPGAAARPAPGTPLRAFIYDRNSRLNPRGGTSIRDQDLENRRLCEAHGWVVADTFEDPGRSASRYAKRGRPDYEEMVRRLDVDDEVRECDVVVVWESSRANRNTRSYLVLQDLCERRGILLCINGRLLDMECSDDRFTAHLDALLAERDVDRIRDNNLRTVRLNAERGRPHGRIAYGWRREYDPDTGALLRQVLHEEQAAVVRDCAARVLAGESMYSIAKDLNARAVPAPHAKEWSQLAVRGLLLRLSNVGKRQHHQTMVDATWEPILDEVTYYGLRRVLTADGRRVNRDSDVTHLLSALVLCGVCAATRAPGSEEPVRVLRPTRSAAGWSYTCRKCYRVSMREPALDALVTMAVFKRVEQPGFAASLAPADGGDAVRAALADAAAMEDQLAQARVLAATVRDGRMALPVGEFMALQAHLTPLIEAARERARDATVPVVLRRLAGPGARTVWRDEFDMRQRRAAIRGLVRVTLFPGGKGMRAVTPQRYEFDWLR